MRLNLLICWLNAPRASQALLNQAKKCHSAMKMPLNSTQNICGCVSRSTALWQIAQIFCRVRRVMAIVCCTSGVARYRSWTKRSEKAQQTKACHQARIKADLRATKRATGNLRNPILYRCALASWASWIWRVWLQANIMGRAKQLEPSGWIRFVRLGAWDDTRSKRCLCVMG